MEHLEIVLTPAGLLRRKTTESAVTDEVLDVVFKQLAKDLVVLTPNLIEPGECFSALHGIATQGGDVWYAAKVRNLVFNGNWFAEADRIYPAPTGGDIPIPDAGDMPVPVPVPLFVFVQPRQSTLFLLALLRVAGPDGQTRKVWNRMPFPNTYSDGRLCPGELPPWDEGKSFAENALRMLRQWVANPWNEDLCGSQTLDFLREIASFRLADGKLAETSAADWEAYADPVNPGIDPINLAFDGLAALYCPDDGKEEKDGGEE